MLFRSARAFTDQKSVGVFLDGQPSTSLIHNGIWQSLVVAQYLQWYGVCTRVHKPFFTDKWWKIAPEALHPLASQSDKYFVSDDFIELIYDQKVYITNIHIYETYNPGAVVRILALDHSVEQKGRKW